MTRVIAGINKIKESVINNHMEFHKICILICYFFEFLSSEDSSFYR